MKTKLRLFSGFTSAALIMGVASIAQAIEPGSAKYLRELAGVPRLELPAKAAELVLAAQGEDRAKQTEAIVTAGVELSADAAPTIVSAVAKTSPDMAPVAATAAAVKQPKQTQLIAKAAATAAPSKAVEIVRAMCKKLPAEFGSIANGVAEAAQKQDRSILNTVVEAVPNLKPFYTRAAEALAKDGEPVVARYVDQITRDIAASAKALKTSEQTLVVAGVTPAQQSLLPSPPAPTTPVQRPAFQPLGGAPAEINRDQTTVIPPTGTRYSSP